MIVDVLACREGTMWAVCALDPDVASQSAAAGAEHDDLLSALEDLGRMLDFYDEGVADGRCQPPVGPAPPEYRTAFDAGDALGLLPLGRCRIARVRIGTSPFAQRKP